MRSCSQPACWPSAEYPKRLKGRLGAEVVMGGGGVVRAMLDVVVML